jgi:hypothetical protein
VLLRDVEAALIEVGGRLVVLVFKLEVCCDLRVLDQRLRDLLLSPEVLTADQLVGHGLEALLRASEGLLRQLVQVDVLQHLLARRHVGGRLHLVVRQVEEVDERLQEPVLCGYTTTYLAALCPKTRASPFPSGPSIPSFPTTKISPRCTYVCSLARIACDVHASFGRLSFFLGVRALLTPYLAIVCILVFPISSSFSINFVFFSTIASFEWGLRIGSNFILGLYFNYKLSLV